MDVLWWSIYTQSGLARATTCTSCPASCNAIPRTTCGRMSPHDPYTKIVMCIQRIPHSDLGVRSSLQLNIRQCREDHLQEQLVQRGALLYIYLRRHAGEIRRGDKHQVQLRKDQDLLAGIARSLK